MSGTGEWIFTFGRGHRHPVTNVEMQNKFVRIKAASEAEARATMVAHFGKKWGFVYRSVEEAGVEKYGLTEMRLGESLPAILAFVDKYERVNAELVQERADLEEKIEKIRVEYEERARLAQTHCPHSWSEWKRAPEATSYSDPGVRTCAVCKKTEKEPPGS